MMKKFSKATYEVQQRWGLSRIQRKWFFNK